MKSECKESVLRFQELNDREVVGQFDGGELSSNGGALLLREAEARMGLIRQFSQCFQDCRHAEWIEHPLADLLKQKLFGLILGYEDVSDHDELRCDSVLALACGKADPFGKDRLRDRDQGKALAGKSTLNRLELSAAFGQPTDRTKKILFHSQQADELLLETYAQSQEADPAWIVLDVDSSDTPLYGQQENRFFHGYYDSYCYLPLYLFVGDHLLLARLNPSDESPVYAGMEDIERVLSWLLQRFPHSRILLRGDTGFSVDELMCVCENHPRIDFLFGLAANPRLQKQIEGLKQQAQAQFEQTQETQKLFTEFDYQTRDSWGRTRRVVAKVEYNQRGDNQRFVVTSLTTEQDPPETLYSTRYCGRGDMENRIKEQQLGLFSDRLSLKAMQANQFRLYCSAIAYTLLRAIREFALKNTPYAKAQSWNMRDLLMKIAVRLKRSLRRFKVEWPNRSPLKNQLPLILTQLQNLPKIE